MQLLYLPLAPDNTSRDNLATMIKVNPQLKDLTIKTLTWGLIGAATTIGVVSITRVYGAPTLSIVSTTTQKQSTFDVSGTSSVDAVPDQAEVSLGVSVNQPTIAATQEEMNQVINRIKDQLAIIGIKKEDIKTTNYNLGPNYDYRNPDGKPTISGYQGSANLRISLEDFNVLNQAIDVATQAGANQVGGVQFSLREETKNELLKQARQEAIDDAKTKARELANIAGMKLGRVVNVYENGGGYQPPIMYARNEIMAMDSAGSEPAAPTQIEPGTTTINLDVTLSFETL